MDLIISGYNPSRRPKLAKRDHAVEITMLKKTMEKCSLGCFQKSKGANTYQITSTVSVQVTCSTSNVSSADGNSCCNRIRLAKKRQGNSKMLRRLSVFVIMPIIMKNARYAGIILKIR